MLAFGMAFLLRHWLCYKFSEAYRFHSSLFVITCSALGRDANKIFYGCVAAMSLMLALFPLYISIPLFILSEMYTLLRGLKNPSQVIVSVP